MPEAVIVSTARSPIGRAHKGSLTSIRPDDLAVQMIQAAVGKVGLTGDQIEDLALGCAEPHDEHGGNMARRVAVQLGWDNTPASHVATVLVVRLRAPQREVLDLVAGQADLADRRLDHLYGEIVRPDRGQRTLVRAADRRAGRGHDDCFRHLEFPFRGRGRGR